MSRAGMNPLYKRLLAGVALIPVLALAGCGTSQPAPKENVAAAAPKGQKSVTIAINGDPPTLNPNFDGATISGWVDSNIFDALLQRNKEGKLEPSLATEWQNPQPDTWNFTLRQNVKFQNGDALTADDVVYSIQRILNPDNKSPRRGDFVWITDVKKTDDTHIQIKTKGAYPAALERLSGLDIVPKAYYEKVGAEGFAKEPVGTGPFKFVSYQHGQQINLEANSSYWRGQPAIDKVVFRIIPEAATQLNELKSGGVDVVPNVAPDQIPSLKSQPNLQIATTPTLRTVMMPMDNHTKPFNDIRVRQAFNYAVDKDAIIKNIEQGLGTPEAGILPSMVAGNNPALKPYPYDPNKAKQLLAEAGYGSGLSVDMNVAGSMRDGAQIADAIRGYLDAVGVKLNLHVYQTIAPYLALWPDKAGPVALTSWGGGFDGDFYYTATVKTGNTYAIFNDPKLDAIIDQANATADPAAHAKLWQQAEQYLYDQAGWVFLWSNNTAYGLTKKVNWAPRVDEGIWVYEMKVN